MPTTYKVLGQSYPTAANNTTLYTAANPAVVSTINICNQAINIDTVSVAIRQAGASLTASQYILFQEVMAPQSALSLTLGITLAATDVITINSTNGTSSFSAFGSEIS
jgi:hypothetical protein